jgi:hypothetical protein
MQTKENTNQLKKEDVTFSFLIPAKELGRINEIAWKRGLSLGALIRITLAKVKR